MGWPVPVLVSPDHGRPALRLVCSNPSRTILDVTPTSSKHTHQIPPDHPAIQEKDPNVHESPKCPRKSQRSATQNPIKYKTRNPTEMSASRAQMSKATPKCPQPRHEPKINPQTQNDNPTIKPGRVEIEPKCPEPSPNVHKLNTCPQGNPKPERERKTRSSP